MMLGFYLFYFESDLSDIISVFMEFCVIINDCYIEVFPLPL